MKFDGNLSYQFNVLNKEKKSEWGNLIPNEDILIKKTAIFEF
jgi:hypothetical protein